MLKLCFLVCQNRHSSGNHVGTLAAAVLTLRQMLDYKEPLLKKDETAFPLDQTRKVWLLVRVCFVLFDDGFAGCCALSNGSISIDFGGFAVSVLQQNV